MSLNEAFAKNMTGKMVSFDVQPYARGTMLIKKITERRVGPIREFSSRNGYQMISYDTFDIEGVVCTGSETPALICGVPISHRSLNDQPYNLVGVSYDQLRRAVEEQATIVQARCG